MRGLRLWAWAAAASAAVRAQANLVAFGSFESPSVAAVCPPGTNRFGNGFFDCSGFVSAAYAHIGVVIPTSTYAMAADERFMAKTISDHVDLPNMLPGDIVLNPGHVALYVGNGTVIHATGSGLTMQPLPGWVRNATIAVLRPLPPADAPPKPESGG